MAAANLSSELLSLIVSYLEAPIVYNPRCCLDSELISCYASVSKQWQAAIESRTFSKLHLTPTRLDESKNIVRGHRRRLVRRIDFNVVLDDYEEEAWSTLESEEEQAQNSRTFTHSLKKLFKILNSWGPNDVASPGIALHLEIYSLRDFCRVSKKVWMARRGRRIKGFDLKNIRFEQSYLRFVDRENEDGKALSLDDMPAITELHFNGGYARKIWAADFSAIVGKLPNLKTLCTCLYDNERKDLNLRRAARNEFTKSLILWPSSIQKLYLKYWDMAPNDESFLPPNLLEGTNGEDYFSINLRNFSLQLKSIELDELVVGPDIFWPKPTIPETPRLFWPHLTSFTLRYTRITPSGQWIFERDPDEPVYSDDSDDDFERWPLSDYMADHQIPALEDQHLKHFRWKANPELMNPLYLAAGNAAANMPRLRHMYIATANNRPSHSFAYEATARSAVATWESSPHFEPSDEVSKAWKQVPRKFLGVELEICFVEGDNYYKDPTPV